jgi:hypothetical protein
MQQNIPYSKESNIELIMVVMNHCPAILVYLYDCHVPLSSHTSLSVVVMCDCPAILAVLWLSCDTIRPLELGLLGTPLRVQY